MDPVYKAFINQLKRINCGIDLAFGHDMNGLKREKAAGTHAIGTDERRHEHDSEDATARQRHQPNGSHRYPNPAQAKIHFNILAGLALVAFLYFARSVILPIVIAYVLSMVLKPFILRLSEWHVPNALGTLLVLGIFFGAIIFGFMQLGQPAMKWVNDAPQNLAKLRQRVDKFYPAEKFQKAADAVNSMGAPTEPAKDGQGQTNGNAQTTAPGSAQPQAQPKPQPQPQPIQVKESGHASAALSWTGELVGGLLETGVLLYMFLVLGDVYFNGILDRTDDVHERKRMLKISQEIRQTISKYLFTVSYINLGLGIAVGGGLYFMGIPNAALWGLMAALLNYIPYFGPIAGIVVVGLVGMLTGNSFQEALLPSGWYLLLHVAEADFLTPALLGRQFTMSPLVIFISLMFWTWLWGPLGALLAVPMLMSIKVICREVPGLAPVYKFL